MANLGGSFFSSYPASGSFNRSGVNVAAGARTPLSAVAAAVFLLILLAFVAPISHYLPMASVAGILLTPLRARSLPGPLRPPPARAATTPSPWPTTSGAAAPRSRRPGTTSTPRPCAAPATAAPRTPRVTVTLVRWPFT